MESKSLPFTESLAGISEQTINIHHDKLYNGYVNKTNEIKMALTPFEQGGDVTTANQLYSQLRSLKTDETFALNGAYLHEYYFDILGGDGITSGVLVDKLTERFGSTENFINYMSGCGMAARGWVVLAWDTQSKSLEIYTGDAHNHGGVWGCIPVIVLDVYEHAYFIDKGSDRKAYIEDFWKNLDWTKANELFTKATQSR